MYVTACVCIPPVLMLPLALCVASALTGGVLLGWGFPDCCRIADMRRKSSCSSVRLCPRGRWQGSALAPEVAELWLWLGVAAPPPAGSRASAASASGSLCCPNSTAAATQGTQAVLGQNLAPSASRSNCELCLAQPDFVSVYIILFEVVLLIMKQYRIKCFIASVLQLIRVCFPFLQVIETLSKLSRTPIALGTGIRYVIAIGNGGTNNASWWDAPWQGC